jgi:hypothetical protein
MLKGGNELCRIEGFNRRKVVSELKVSIEAGAGLVPALTRLINPESHVELQDHLTLEDAGLLSEHALAEGVIQLYAQTLKKVVQVVVADELQIAPGQVTDSKLASLCDRIRDDPPDILVLCGCRCVTNISCLVQLSTISHLDISGCNLGAKGCFHLAGTIKDMGALLSLDISNNKLVGTKRVTLKEIPSWWNEKTMGVYGNRDDHYEVLPDLDGVIAFANAIRDMRALSSLVLKDTRLLTAEAGKVLSDMLATNTVLKVLDLSSNNWKAYGNLMGDGPGFAKELAVGISDNRAMTKLDISKNDLRAEGGRALAVGLKDNRVMMELNIAGNRLTLNANGNAYDDMSGVAALAGAIPSMGALSMLSHKTEYD